MGSSNNYSDYVRNGEDCYAILNYLPRLVMLVDLDGTIVYWSEGGELLLGYTPDEVKGKPIWSLFTAYSESHFLSDLNFLHRGGSTERELETIHKNGSFRVTELKQKTITLSQGKEVVLATAGDITETVQIQKKLLQSERRMQAILDTAVEGIITINREANIQEFNKAAEQIFGYKASEVIGKNIKILMPSPYREEHDQYIENYHRTGNPKIIGVGREVRGKRKNGEIFPMHLAVSEVRVNGDTYYTGIVRDISERRRLENEILQISEDERRKIGRELHDGLGQMLTGVGLIAQNLARKLKANELPGGEQVQEIADIIKEADEQARTLAHGLVHIELEEQGFQVALQQLCERAQKLFNIKCLQDLGERIEIDDKTASLHLYRIVQEAISNAAKHGKAQKVEVQMGVEDGYLSLSVIDDGIGFSNPENRKKLKGIGLNTMSYRAHLLGGYINVKESEQGNTVIDCKVPIQEFQNFKKKG